MFRINVAVQRDFRVFTGHYQVHYLISRCYGNMILVVCYDTGGRLHNTMLSFLARFRDHNMGLMCCNLYLISSNIRLALH